MIVKNLCDDSVKQEIVERLSKLSPETPGQWGKMNVSQMLAHLQMPMGVGIGVHKLPRSFVGRIFGGMIKKILYDEKPFKRNLPTDKSFVMTSPKEFEKEKQQLLDMIARFKEENIVDTPHPFFGKLTKEQWGKGTWKHLDHHLQQFGV